MLTLIYSPLRQSDNFASRINLEGEPWPIAEVIVENGILTPAKGGRLLVK